MLLRMIGAWWLLMVAGLAAHAAAAESYDFNGPARTYLYDLKQEVSWQSAGDKLTFTSQVAWKLVIKARKVEGGKAELAATVVRVIASHRGPGSEHSFDSASGKDDELLGHLKAVEGAVLTLDVDCATGAVAAVRGGEGIAAAVAARAPNRADPQAPSPLAAAATTAYSPEALRRQWDALLALPAAATSVSLGLPLTGTATRTWTGADWTLGLPAEALPMAITLVRDPTPVNGRVMTFAATGSGGAAKGWPGGGRGDLRFTLELGALTQPVAQDHHLTWTFSDVTPR